MDLFRLGLRNLMGVFAPGAFFVLVSIYVLFCAFHSLGRDIQIGEHETVPMLTALFLISYLFGSLFRLNSADKVDKISAKLLQRELAGFDYNELETTGGLIRKGITKVAIAKKLDDTWRVFGPHAPEIASLTSGEGRDDIDVIWRLDHFPYPVWHFFKLCLFHTPEAYRFFWTYRDCMRHKESPKKLGKEFFNFCKTTIHHAQRDLGDALIYEVQDAEAQVRFFAGTFYALFYGVVMLGVLLGLLVFELVFHDWLVTAHIHVPTQLGLGLGCLSTGALLIGMFTMGLMIVGRFRTLRLKEVDIVYDAFYLLHQHPVSCNYCSTSLAESRISKYAARTRLVEEAFALSAKPGEKTPAMILDELVRLMKSEGKKEPYLSSLYFAGADCDHPYFLHNEKVAIGLAVLPEDKDKAGEWKKHPHQTEVIFVLDGSLILEHEIGGKDVTETLKEGDVREIKPGTCHCVYPVAGRDSSYLFVKTAPAKEPREMPCGHGLRANVNEMPDARGDVS